MRFINIYFLFVSRCYHPKLEKLKEIYLRLLTLNIHTMDHPEYTRQVRFDVWVPLYGHRSTDTAVRKHDKYEVMLLNDNNGCMIRSMKRNRAGTNMILRPTMNIDGIRYTTTHIIVASAFPDIVPKETVDHINLDAFNNNILNLRWMTKSDNCASGSVAQKTARNGTHVDMINDLGDVEMTFISIESASRYIADNLSNENGVVGQRKTIASKIREVLSGRRACKAYGHNWKYSVDVIVYENERWRDFNLGTRIIQVSDHGRVRNSYGDIISGAKARHNKYRSVSCVNANTNTTDRQYIHRMVYEAFNGAIPADKHILHDDNAPLDTEGYYRNWLCDLKTGTRSENMNDFYEHKKTTGVKSVIPITSDIATGSVEIQMPVTRRNYQIGNKVVNVEQFNASVITNKNNIICDTQDIESITHASLSGDRVSVNGNRMTIGTFVWTNLMKNTVPEGWCVKPVNRFTLDVRRANLELFHGDPKSMQLPKQIHLTTEEQEELGVAYLPRYVSINKGRLSVSSHIEHDLNTVISKKVALRHNLELYVSHFLKQWYNLKNISYDDDQARYLKLVTEYFMIMDNV